MKLYICLTYYHILITLIKSLVNEEKYDLFIANDIPECEKLYDRLSETERFRNIYFFDAVNSKKELAFNSRFDRVFNEKRRIGKVIAKYLNIDLSSYDDIYIYHDFSPIGKYLICKHIRYHLLEDALDYFKYFDKYYRLDESTYTPGTLKFILKGITGFHCWGMSDAAIDIEVNDLDGIIIPKDKCFAVPRKELFAKLNSKERILVFDTFAAGKKVGTAQGKTAILCTQPLCQDKFVSTMEEQERVFESIVKSYHSDGYQVIIKPHPRDLMDYSSIIRAYECGFIDKNLPSEILNFNPEAKYDVAISITSTAINFLEYALEKRFMGKEYINEVLDNAI